MQGTIEAAACDRELHDISQCLFRAADLQPSAGIHSLASDPGGATFLSYPELLDAALGIAAGLQRHARDHQYVVVLLEQPEEFLPAFWGCILAGHVPCPMPLAYRHEARWEQHISHVHQILQQPFYLCRDVSAQVLPEGAVASTVPNLRAPVAAYRARTAATADAALIVLTSGSTGLPKAAMLTHANLLASMAGKRAKQDLSEQDVTLNWISFDHVAGLLEAHLLPLFVMANQLHASTASFLADPMNFLRTVHRYKVSMTFAPNFFLGQLIAATESLEPSLSDLDLSSLRRIISGGEANVVATGRRFLDVLGRYGLRRDCLWPAFGMTETCAGCIYSEGFPESDIDSEFATVGSPISGLEIRIAEGATALPAGECGELQVRGPMILTRYLNNETATRATFTQDGWFRTGDLGKIEAGKLRLVGRSKDSIVVNGVNYFSQELETSLERLDGIQPSYVAAFPLRPAGSQTEQLVIAFAATPAWSSAGKLRQLLVAIRNTTVMTWGFRPALILPLPEAAFQKTSLGKIQRSVMRTRLERGDFDREIESVESITKRRPHDRIFPSGPMEAEILSVFAEILAQDATALSVDDSFLELGGTSLELLRLTRMLEQKFKVRATLVTVLQHPTAGALSAYIQAESSNEAEYDPVVLLQRSGSKTPLFCFHPGNGSVITYVNLAKYFAGERPFYAMRPRGFRPSEPVFETFEAMIESYYSAIRGRQAHGPYALAGYSLGGAIAFEVANRLQQDGERISFLGCIDIYPCGQEPKIDYPMAAVILAWLLQLIDSPTQIELATKIGAELDPADVLEHVYRLSSPSRLAELDLDLNKFADWVRVAHSLKNISGQRATTGHIDRMTIFHSDGLASDPEGWRQALGAWDERVTQPKYVRVPGSHFTLMDPAHVVQFQSIFRRELEIAEAIEACGNDIVLRQNDA